MQPLKRKWQPDGRTDSKSIPRSIIQNNGFVWQQEEHLYSWTRSSPGKVPGCWNHQDPRWELARWAAEAGKDSLNSSHVHVLPTVEISRTAESQAETAEEKPHLQNPPGSVHEQRGKIHCPGGSRWERHWSFREEQGKLPWSRMPATTPPSPCPCW